MACGGGWCPASPSRVASRAMAPARAGVSGSANTARRSERRADRVAIRRRAVADEPDRRPATEAATRTTSGSPAADRPWAAEVRGRPRRAPRRPRPARHPPRWPRSPPPSARATSASASSAETPMQRLARRERQPLHRRDADPQAGERSGTGRHREEIDVRQPQLVASEQLGDLAGSRTAAGRSRVARELVDHDAVARQRRSCRCASSCPAPG